MTLRVIYFGSGVILCCVSVAMFNRTYIFPEVVDMVPRGVVKKFGVKFFVAKYSFDFFYLVLGIVLSLVFFGEIRGLGLGTIVMVLTNGFLINGTISLLDRYIEFRPIAKKLAKVFDF